MVSILNMAAGVCMLIFDAIGAFQNRRVLAVLIGAGAGLVMTVIIN
ncbi:MAG: hypothetical protein FWB79_06215 [Treponema sp.]|nr:hypothetical protein [Treponema sp.]